MRLPHSLTSSLFFTLETAQELITALDLPSDSEETGEIRRLSELGLPPVTSDDALAVMLGINPGLVWSFLHRNGKYYDRYEIKTSKKVRVITAPKTSLKIVQKWLSFHFQSSFQAPDHVFGFVQARSHLNAAQVHCGSSWVQSFDIRDFFRSTPLTTVMIALIDRGYSEQSAFIIAKLCTCNGFLAQGAPSSPVLSNICFTSVDQELSQIAQRRGLTLSRYADDIVFSSATDPQHDLVDEINALFAGTPWRIAEEKSKLSALPNRLKVHGLLVHGERPRLTKGYRNRLRAFNHLMEKGKIRSGEEKKIIGHLMYQRQVQNFTSTDTDR